VIVPHLFVHQDQRDRRELLEIVDRLVLQDLKARKEIKETVENLDHSDLKEMLVRMKSGSLGPKGVAGTYEIWITRT